MTELASAPGERAADSNGGRDRAHPPLDRRRLGGGHIGPHGPGVQPGDGTADGRGRPRVGGGGRRCGAGGEGGVRLVAGGVAREARGADVQHPRARARAQGGDREAARGRARQGAVGRDGRGDARARGDRVRVRDPDPVEGRVLGAGLDRASTSTRSGSRSASSRASRRSTSRRWCRCGCGRRRSRAATRSS